MNLRAFTSLNEGFMGVEPYLPLSFGHCSTLKGSPRSLISISPPRNCSTALSRVSLASCSLTVVAGIFQILHR